MPQTGEINPYSQNYIIGLAILAGTHCLKIHVTVTRIFQAVSTSRYSKAHNIMTSQTIAVLPIRSLIRLCWWRPASIAIARTNVRTLEGETRIIKNPIE